MADYADLVDYIVRSIVDNPDSVEVEAHTSNRSDVVEIRLDPSDVGKVIGKGGRTIEAIRSLVKAAAVKDHRRVNVEVIADEAPAKGDADGELAAVDGGSAEGELG
jgi:predicted RNA-binding protein YlqC (UPF0109 family)